ncbi:protein ALP1-like [Amphibalanus amphitrite]|uniref:protein ALP1-like n=1 Tax=Amphibalanus amphitrite TaxID=1232801 RepID=UPI001C916BD4|nr:protein ALP1-like [Amphibalanus amphitrite]XP_043230459.1 protein ALP1-like [Amphibalanus amphitrite]XP_043231922.1 protein ALP1-like [Amphibalanus amphitrite]XP_043233373.1 protein ALP1-like [Amphibalanus amphitrite]XP_043243612.1 protein ALP1-like [Amphibalanus amphitrite]
MELNIARIALSTTRIRVEQERRRARRRYWVAEVLQRRQARGEFFNLVQELRAVDPDRHHAYFRMSRETFDLLLAKIGPSITRQRTNFREPIDPAQRLAVTLRYLASGMEFSALAPCYRLGEKTVRAIVYDTCAAIIAILGPEVLPAPTRATWERSEEIFRTQWNFPNCVAALDGKHVVLQAPSNSGSEYYNYKKSFSIVLLAAVDGAYRFVYTSVGSAGRESDGGIFRRSDLAAKLQDGTLDLPPPKAIDQRGTTLPSVIVADEAFPLTVHMMRPYPGRTESRLGAPATIFNYRLSRARRVVENAFGILSQTWRIFRRPLNVNPEHACTIVRTACILHNYVRDQGQADSQQPQQADASGEQVGGLCELGRLGANNFTREAERIRDQFARYFMAEGAVPWQDAAVGQ